MRTALRALSRCLPPRLGELVHSSHGGATHLCMGMGKVNCSWLSDSLQADDPPPGGCIILRGGRLSGRGSLSGKVGFFLEWGENYSQSGVEVLIWEFRKKLRPNWAGNRSAKSRQEFNLKVFLNWD